MNRFALTFAAILGFASSSIASAGVFNVTAPGPLSSTDISLRIDNDDGFDLLKVTFDLSTTKSFASGNPPLTFGGIVSTTPPAGGTATVFGTLQSTSFGFDFTSFNNGEWFSFSWDPDIATDSSYGAVVSEMAGMGIELVTSGGTVSGTLRVDSDRLGLVATIDSPTGVPEPGTVGLLGIGAALLGLARRRRIR
ncbi:MAG: PEP-CTERM sorting domain-containing protein [Burkholderiales bacterium]|nr:PEP-CTERM sorting domain-containing protein [Burkholderiales bacterium]